MKRIREKTARRLMAFLAAVCMVGTMPGTAVISHAEERVEEFSEINHADTDGQEENQKDANAKEQAGGPEQEEKKIEEGAEKPKDTEESEDTEETGDTEGAEDTEKSGDQEDIGESDAGKTDNSEEDSKKEETPDEIPEGEQDAEDKETDTGEATDGEEVIGEEETVEEAESEETEEAGIMLLSAQEDSSVVQDTNTYTDENGVIYHYYGYEDGTAEIYELEFYKEIVGKYKPLNIPSQVGDYTVTSLTFTFSSTSSLIPSVTIPETITYMEGSLFKFMTILELYYNAEAAETGATGESSGVFYRGDIRAFHLGENVRSIPDYCFDSTTMTIDELTLNVESIGRKAFYNDKKITTLTLGENVGYIGFEAFGENEIENINYNAVNAQSAPYGQLAGGTFNNVSVSTIIIGGQVTVIPEHLFCNIYFTADTLEFPDCLTTVGAWAFHGNDITIGELTIGENVTSIGEEAFARGQIGVLNYNAVDARVALAEEVNEQYRSSFDESEIGELRIGNRVKSLPDTLFYAIGLTQDTLVLPDSITYIGAYVLSHSGDATSGKTVQIGTLEIGENVTHIGRAAFGRNTYDKVVVRTVEADVPPQSDMQIELPICSEIEIHGKSPYYAFFTRNTDKDHITMLCEDFEAIRGEEYYDAGKKFFVTPITDACTVCGYGTTRNDYSQAYMVIFTDYDGTELSRQHLHKGDDATAPEAPERTGYEFTGWDKAFTGVTSDMTVRAEYEIKKFSVLFKDGGHTISEQEIEYGKDAEAPENPTRPEEEWGNWRFIGWDGSYTNVTKDEVVTAQFEKVLNEYEVIFFDAEGNVISRQTIAHGEAAEEPEAPEKESTAQYTYIFTGWSADTENITEDTEFRPVYDSETRSYTVKFMDGSTVLDTQTVAYGYEATAPEAPTRPEEEWGTWKFTGWSGIYTNITKDEIIRAVFEKVLNQYEVIFYDTDGNILSRQTIAHGGDAKVPENPTRPEEEWGNWRFTGWDGSYTNVTKDEVVTAQFEKVLNQYEVLFYDAEGKVISRQTIAHGEAAEEPEAPEKEPTEQYTYTFIGWSAETESITGDTEFRPVYDLETRSYTVKFMDGSTVLDTQTVAYGDDAVTPADPVRPEEEWGNWRFTGWSGSYTNITRDEVIRAVFEKVLNQYEVIFYDADDNILSRQTVKHGMGAEAPKVPDIEPTERECYVFTGWDGDISNITKETHFHPVYETKARTYTVTFMNGDITHNVQEVAYGSAASTPSNPSRKEDKVYTYRFICWDKDYSYIKSDMTIRAVFEQVVKPKDGDTDEEKPKEVEKEKPKVDDRDEDKSGDGEPIAEVVKKIVVSVPDAISGNDTEKKLLLKLGLPQMEEKQEPAFPVPEIPDESLQPTKKEVQIKKPVDEKVEDKKPVYEEPETTQKTEPEETGNTDRHISGWLWLLLLIGAGTGAWGIWLWLAGTGERTICGTVVDEDGNAMSGVNVTLTGEEGNPVEMQTDEDGQYLFKDLKKDSYRLCFHYIDATGLLLLDIHMERRDRKKVFSILKSTVNAVETRRSGGKYQIDVTI